MDNTTQNRPKDPGVAWIKDGKNGKYMSATMTTPSGEKVDFLMFKNRFKKLDNHPDYIIKFRDKNYGGKNEQSNGNGKLQQEVNEVFGSGK